LDFWFFKFAIQTNTQYGNKILAKKAVNNGYVARLDGPANNKLLTLSLGFDSHRHSKTRAASRFQLIQNAAKDNDVD
jgi:hypothetical protein